MLKPLSSERIEVLLSDYRTHLERCAKKEKGKEKRRVELTPARISKLLDLARLQLSRLWIPETNADRGPASVGQTVIRNGQPHQDHSTVKAVIFESGQDRLDFTRGEIGIKGSGPCVYDAIFLLKGFPNSWNCPAIMTMTIDLDAKVDKVTGELHSALETEEDEAKADELAVRLGGVLIHTTSSHDPLRKGKRCRKYQWICEPISYLERKDFGLLLREEFAKVLKISKDSPRWACIDPIAERGVQLQHVPRWVDEIQAQQAVLRLVEGPAMDFAAWRAIVAERKAQEAALAAEKAREVNAAQPTGMTPPGVTTSSAGIEPTREERIAWARAKLAAHGPRDARGGSRTFKAILVGVLAGLKEDDFFPLLREWNDTLGADRWDEGELYDKMVRGYASARVDFGSAFQNRRPRAPVAVSVLWGTGGDTLTVDLDTRPGVTTCSVNSPAPTSGDTTTSSPLADLGGAEMEDLADEIARSVVSPTEPEYSLLPELPKPKKVPNVNTAELDLIEPEHLTTKVLVLDSGTGTRKTVAIRHCAKQILARGGRVVVVVPNQSLSASGARKFGIQSHMDPHCDWSGSLVTCIHSLHKVQLYKELPLPAGPCSFEDSDPLYCPIDLLVFDELGELADIRTDELIKGERKCDLLQKKARELCDDAKNIIAAYAGLEVTDLACLLEDWCGWVGDRAKEADWSLLVNRGQAMKPEVYLGGRPQRLRREMLRAYKEGVKSIAYCGTVMTSEVEAVVFAANVMSENAGFDVSPFLGVGSKDALAPAEKLPELVAELDKRGLRLEDIRPKVLIINAHRHDEAVQAFLADPDAQLEHYDAVFHTSTIQSGFSIEQHVLAVFGFLVAGSGPGTHGIHQALMRCRRSHKNRIHVAITGRSTSRSTDPEWWHSKLQRWSKETLSLLDGLTVPQSTTRKFDGSVWLVGYDKLLLRAEAWRLARVDLRGQIEDHLDDMGRVVRPGGLTELWTSLGWDVIHMYETEFEESCNTPIDVEIAQKSVEKARRKAIRRSEHEHVATPSRLATKREAEELRKKKARDPEIHAIIRNAEIRWRYGLTSLSVADVEWDHKHGKQLSEFAVTAAMHLDARKVVQNQAASEGPLAVHQRHRCARGLQLMRWLDALGLSDLEAVAASGAPLPSFGEYLRHRPLDQEILADFGIHIRKESDLEGTRLTVALLRVMGLRTKRIQVRHGGRKGTREWVRVLLLKSVEEMRSKAKASVERLLDPEKAREAWDTMELEARLGVSRINDEEMIAALLDGHPAANTTTPAAA